VLLGTSQEAFGNLGGTNWEEGGEKQKIPPTPSRKGKKQAHQEGMLLM
jgi:hypothetical protein